MLKITISLLIGAIIWVLLVFSYNTYTWNAKQTNFRNERWSFSWWTWSLQWRSWRNMSQEQQIEIINQRTWIAKDIIKTELDEGKTMRQIISENSSVSWTGAKISWTGSSL